MSGVFFSFNVFYALKQLLVLYTKNDNMSAYTFSQQSCKQLLQAVLEAGGTANWRMHL